MLRYSLFPRQRRLLLCLALSLGSLPAFAIEAWRAITPEEVAQTASVVDPEAGAEILFREQWVSQSLANYRLVGSSRYYQRAKVFTEAGVSKMSPVRLYYRKGERITKVIARTVKPDGRIFELDSSTVYETELEKSKDRRLRAKAFTFPSLEPGDIVEYQYTLALASNSGTTGTGFYSNIPAQRVKFGFKPAATEFLAVRQSAFQFPEATMDMKGGYYVYEKTNLPAEPDEPFSIPEMHRQPWVILYYIPIAEMSDRNYWREEGRKLLKEGKKRLSPARIVEEKARSLASGATTDEERLRRLHDFCVTEIANRSYDFNRFTDTEVEDMADDDDVEQTLERGHGSPRGIRYLFGAMASALGFEVRLMKAPDARDIDFDPVMKVPFALEIDLLAVKQGENWLYLNPGNPTLPFGVPDWFVAGTKALLADKEEVFVDIPRPAADFNILRRNARLRLAEDGSLAGRVTLTAEGYIAADLRETLEELTGDERENHIKEFITDGQPQAKITSISIEDERSPNAPLTIAFDVSVSEYAEVVGDRIFLQPSFFEKGGEATFEAETRTTPIFFPYAWTEEDKVRIAPPEGFRIETGTAPEPIALGDLWTYKPTLNVAKKDGAVVYSRHFEAKQNRFVAKAYEPLKALLAHIDANDAVAVTYLRETSAPDVAATSE